MRKILNPNLKQGLNYLSIISLIIFFVFTYSGCNSGGDDKSKGNNSLAKSTVEVEVVNPSLIEFKAKLKITGKVMANKEVRLFAQVGGYLRELHVDIGDEVNSGQVIATIDNPELVAALQNAIADHNMKKVIYDRISQIWEKTPDLTTIMELEKAKAAWEGSKALMQGYANQSSYLNIKAPFKGVITARYLHQGAAIQPGISSDATPIVDIQDLDIVRIGIDVPEPDVPLVGNETEVAITIPELPGDTFRAQVTRYSYALNPKSKTMRVEIDLINKDKKIRPGMYARVIMELGSHPNTLSVPRIAVGTSDGQNYIYIISDGVAHQKDVTLGFGNKFFIEILGFDLKEDDLVVVQGKEIISEGKKVKAIMKKQENSIKE